MGACPRMAGLISRTREMRHNTNVILAGEWTATAWWTRHLYNAKNKRSWRFILSPFWNIATNKRSWRFIFSNFIKIRLCLIRCHVCTMMVQMWHCIWMLVWIYLQHFLTVFAKDKCSFIYFSNVFLNLVLKINVHLRFIQVSRMHHRSFAPNTLFMSMPL